VTLEHFLGTTLACTTFILGMVALVSV